MMEATQDPLVQLDQALRMKEDICSAWQAVHDFPSILKYPFRTFGVGLIVCTHGTFDCLIESERYTVQVGESVILSEDVLFQVLNTSTDLEVYFLVFRVETIRDILGNHVQPIQLYIKMSPNVYFVWKTGEDDDLIRYMHLLEKTLNNKDNLFMLYEQKLLLLSLTNRLCSIFQRKYLSVEPTSVRRTKIFLRLIELIDQFYMKERGVEFYADKLCLSAKYLSGLSKSVCGYTVQELVFKAIIRKSISYLNSTTKTIQEISNDFNFPNPSSFGTFFKKQTGSSPQKYREKQGL